MREKHDFVRADTWIFGCSKHTAETVYKQEKAKGNDAYIRNVIACFERNAARSFATD